MKKEIDKDHWTKEDEDNLTNSKFVKLKLELEESDGCKIDPNEENDEQKKDYSKEKVNYAVAKRQQIKISCK